LVIDADELARDAVAPGSAGLREIAEHWPAVVQNGELDRPALAKIVFADPAQREVLNAIVHPLVRRLHFEREAGSGADTIVVHEVPLLFESGFAAVCDANVAVFAPRETRVARLLARGGLTRDDIEGRMAAQMDPDEVRARSDYVIENDGTLGQLRERVTALYGVLRNSAARPR
jgi:dephospho-CoA kinase